MNSVGSVDWREVLGLGVMAMRAPNREGNESLPSSRFAGNEGSSACFFVLSSCEAARSSARASKPKSTPPADGVDSNYTCASNKLFWPGTRLAGASEKLMGVLGGVDTRWGRGT